jgi:hypothetical protein
MDHDFTQRLDQTKIDFGLDSRADALIMMAEGWMSAMMENATIHTIVQQSVRDLKKAEFTALAEFYEGRARIYR